MASKAPPAPPPPPAMCEPRVPAQPPPPPPPPACSSTPIAVGIRFPVSSVLIQLGSFCIIVMPLDVLWTVSVQLYEFS